MKIKKLNKTEITNALPFIWKVFCDFEAVNYTEENKRAFYNAIHDDCYINSLTAYGAFVEEKLIGIIATRIGMQNETHIALFFVDAKFQKQGVGKTLFNTVLFDVKKSVEHSLDSKKQTIKITVHSSVFAEAIYKKLGFTATEKLQEKDGIQFIQMEYKIE